MAISAGAAILGSTAIGVGGALLSSKASKDAAKSASSSAERTAQIQADLIWKMFNITRDDYAPYRGIGLDALKQLSPGSFEKGGGAYVDPEAAKALAPQQSYLTNANQFQKWNPREHLTPAQIEQDKAQGGHWENRFIESGGYDSVGKPAGRTLRQWVPAQQVDQAVDQKTARDVGGGGFELHGGQQTGYKRLPGQQPINVPPGGIDPSGEAQKYLDQLEDLTFELDENDPIYQWRKKEGEKTINAALAARGLHDSRVAVNRLSDYDMALQSDETDRQFNQNYLRKYGQTMDLFNMASNIGAKKYGKQLDLANLGYGATAGSASSATAAGNQLSSVYGAMGVGQQNNYLRQGQADAAFWSGIGGLPANLLATYGYGKQAGLWGNK